ncbi:augmin subunit 6 [Tanacetum coccineum]
MTIPSRVSDLDLQKARIALERRRFLKNAETAVQRQDMWSNLAHEMTEEYRGLCADEMEGEQWDELVSSSSHNCDGLMHCSAKANDGEGPDLLRSANDGGTSGHAESLAATLAEHRQHLANLAFSVRICVSFLRGDIIILFTLVPAQVLVNQLKGVAPAIQNSISELSSSDVVTDVTSRLSSVHIDKVSSSPAALKLPPLFSLRPNSAAKSGNFYKKQAQVNNNQMDNVSENLLHEQTVPNSHAVTSQTDNENDYIRNLKKSVREAALSTRSSNTAQSQDSHSDDGSGTGFSRVGPEKKPASLRSKQLFVPESQTCLVENRVSGGFKYSESLDTCSNFDMLNDYDGVNGFLSAAASNYAESEGRLSFYDVEGSHEQVFSPPFLMDASLSADSFEDLLETETAALMEH